jgi:hypothetical protein
MNFDELQKTWGQQTVAGNRVPTGHIRELLVREVRARSARIRRIIGVAAFVFVTGWVVTLTAHFTGIAPFTPVTLGVFIAGSLFDLGFLALAFRSLRRMRREAANMGGALLDFVQASLRAVDWQIRDCVLLASALPFMLAGSVLASLLKYFSGHLPGFGAVTGIAVSLVFVGAIAATIRRYYRDQLIPRREELRRQLAALET